MTTRRRTNQRRSKDAEVVEKLMELTCGVLASRLGSWTAVASRLEEAARVTRYRKHPIDAETTGMRDLAGDEASKIIWHWYITPEYVDDSGRPLPLKVWGAAPSIEALALVHGIPRSALIERLDLINRVRGLREIKAGLYVPVRQTLMITDDEAAMRRRGEKILLRMIETFVHNLSEGDGAAREFERSVHVARLDPAEVPAFRRFLDGQGRAFVEAVDFWLEKHQTAVDGEGAEVMVEIFSRVTPGTTAKKKTPIAKSTPSTSPRARKARSGGRA